jgi:hypothetical protein
MRSLTGQLQASQPRLPEEARAVKTLPVKTLPIKTLPIKTPPIKTPRLKPAART